jgi:H+/Cl- antiporter ClcA
MLPERTTRGTSSDDPDVRSLPLIYIVLPGVFCIAIGSLIMYDIYRVYSSDSDIESTNLWVGVLAFGVGFVLACSGLYGLWLWTQTWEGAPKATAPSLFCIAAGWSMMGYIIYQGHYYPETRPKAWSQGYWLSVFTINVGCLLGFTGLHGLRLWVRTWEGGPDAVVAEKANNIEEKEDTPMQVEKHRARAFSYYGALTE